MLTVYIFVTAFLLDLAMGDPRFITHPVVLIGKVIEKGEQILRKITVGPGSEKIAGAVLTVFVVLTTYLTVFMIIKLFYSINLWLGVIVNVWVLSMTLAAKGLAAAAKEIQGFLNKEELPKARKAVSMVVGRDTDNLSGQEIIRATIETVAENLVDGIIAPLFYALIGGAPLAMAYKAVNTLDSMIGYKNARYLNFGWFAAKLDDVANYLPARLVIPLLLAAASLLKLDTRSAFAALRRDASKHPSPNGGIPESLVAGALGIQLGGLNYYFGKPSLRAVMGDRKRDMTISDISVTNNLMLLTSSLALVVGTVYLLVI